MYSHYDLMTIDLIEKIKKPDLFIIGIVIIFIIGFLLRFHMLQNFIISGDNARDVLIASYAVHIRELPLIGPFSSAGPFVTGPLYFWILMAGVVLIPLGIKSLWILFFILNLITILVFIYIGYLLGKKKLALILGFFSAISINLFNLAINVTNPNLIVLFEALMLLFFILFIQKKKLIYAVLMGLSLGLAFNMHYQAVNLLIFIPVVFLIKGVNLKKKFIAFVLIILGFVITLAPLLYWDSHQRFANINNILDYFLIAQYRMYVANSWKIFIFQDMAYFWGNVIGGSKILGLFNMLLIGAAALVSFVRFKKVKANQEMFLIGGIFFVLLFLNRYYHGLRSELYLLYFLPFILIFLSVSFYIFLNYFEKSKIKYLVIIILAAISFTTLRQDSKILKAQDSNLDGYKKTLEEISAKYPNQKFSLYDEDGRNAFASSPLSLVMFHMNLQDKDGMKIAIECAPGKECKEHKNKIGEAGGMPITDATIYSQETIDKNFANVNREGIHESLIGWSKRNELKSSFNLKNYLLERVGLK